jgi:hypothetical protein
MNKQTNQKKSSFILALILLYSFNSFADYEWNFRKNCRWWRAKYKTIARVQGPTHADGCDDVDKNCHGVESYCVKKKNCFYGYDSAYAFAMNFSNPIFRGGAARSRYTQCMDYAAGKINMFELSRHSIKPIRIRLSGISDALIESRFSCDTVTFNEDSNSVTLHNLWGFIKVDSDDPESYFSVAMLRIQEALADSIEDGAPTIYWHG